MRKTRERQVCIIPSHLDKTRNNKLFLCRCFHSYASIQDCLSVEIQMGCPVGCSVRECGCRDPMWVEKRERMSEPSKKGKEMKEYQKHTHICMLLKKYI